MSSTRKFEIKLLSVKIPNILPYIFESSLFYVAVCLLLPRFKEIFKVKLNKFKRTESPTPHSKRASMSVVSIFSRPSLCLDTDSGKYSASDELSSNSSSTGAAVMTGR